MGDICTVFFNKNLALTLPWIKIHHGSLSLRSDLTYKPPEFIKKKKKKAKLTQGKSAADKRLTLHLPVETPKA